MENRKIEIWLVGRKLCEITEGNEALKDFERIVKKAGYSVLEKIEDDKLIKMV